MTTWYRAICQPAMRKPDRMGGVVQGTVTPVVRGMILFQAHVGYWRATVERAMPRSRFLVQENRDVYLELARTSQAAIFVSDAGMSNADTSGRTVVPISDVEAHPTFWLLMRADARDEVRALFELVPQQRIVNPL